VTRSAATWWALGFGALLFSAGPWPFNPACHVWSYGLWAWTNGGMWMAPKHWIDLAFHVLQAIFAWTALTLAIAETWQAWPKGTTAAPVSAATPHPPDAASEESR
jgi:hypothetical protein